MISKPKYQVQRDFYSILFYSFLFFSFLFFSFLFFSFLFFSKKKHTFLKDLYDALIYAAFKWKFSLDKINQIY